MRGVEDEHGGRYKEVTGGGLLTSVEDPKGDQLNLDNCGDDTNPTPGRERFGQHPGAVVFNLNAHTTKSLDCKSLKPLPSCSHERDKVNEIAAWMKTLVYT